MKGLGLIFILISIIIYINFKNYNENYQNKNNNKKIIFLLRSYNRPEYLIETLKYLDKSDVNNCIKKIIYDDNSNKETLKILKNYEKKYEIIYNNKNLKQKSMVKFLDIINKKYKDYDFICYLDNDAIVKHDFIEKCVNTFNLIKKKENLCDNKIILTGFNCTNHGITKKYNKYVKKNSIGGIHMFFHKSLTYKILNWWDKGEDWGIVREFKKEKGEFFSTKPSIIQHIGKIGHNSNGIKYDKSDDF